MSGHSFAPRWDRVGVGSGGDTNHIWWVESGVTLRLPRGSEQPHPSGIFLSPVVWNRGKKKYLSWCSLMLGPHPLLGYHFLPYLPSSRVLECLKRNPACLELPSRALHLSFLDLDVFVIYTPTGEGSRQCGDPIGHCWGLKERTESLGT